MRPTLPHASRPYVPSRRRARLRAGSALCGAAAILLLAAVAAQPAQANPQGGSVVAGSATISAPSSTSTTVTQSTGKAIIDWQSFSIGSGETTTFIQPSSDSVTLNRVTGGDASQILGRLTANGQVWIVNPNGIFFGSAATIDVAGLLATTADIKNADFMAGRYNFSAAGQTGYVINQGAITVKDTGLVGLVAPYVANSGLITARLGEVALAAGTQFTVDLYGDQMINLALDKPVTAPVKDNTGKTVSSLVENTGKIFADGGRVTMTAAAAKGVVDKVINTSGVVQANSVAEKNGEIWLLGEGGEVEVAGTIQAVGVAQGSSGGAVVVSGDTVKVKSTAKIDVSGAKGGGQALIGGDVQGGAASAATLAQYGTSAYKKPVTTAKKTTVDSGATIKADATINGKGGKVIVWADEDTLSYASISAKGGPQGGDGGFIETSGKVSLSVGGVVSASAAMGVGGVWLMDPNNVVIGTSTTAGVWTGGSPTSLTATTTGTVNFQDINDALNAGTSVVVTADGTIDVNNAIAKSSGANTSLKLSAGGNLTIAAAVSATGANALDLTLESCGTCTITLGAAISLNGGTLKAGTSAAGAVGTLSQTAAGTINAGSATMKGGAMTLEGGLTATGTVGLEGTDVLVKSNVSGSDVSIKGATSLTVNNSSTVTGSGNVTLEGTSVTLASSASTIKLTGSSKTLDIKADTLAMNTVGGALTTSGTGDTLVIEPYTWGTNVKVGTVPTGFTGLFISADGLTAERGFTSLKIGGSSIATTRAATITGGDGGTVTLPTNTEFYGTTLTVNGTLAVGANDSLKAYLSSTKSFNLATGNALSAHDLLIQVGAITITGTLNETGATGTGTIELDATAAAGYVTISPTATLTHAGTVDTVIKSDNSVTVSNAWNAGTTGGAFKIGGYSAATFPGVTIDGSVDAGSASIEGSAVTVAAAGLLSTGGDISITSKTGGITIDGIVSAATTATPVVAAGGNVTLTTTATGQTFSAGSASKITAGDNKVLTVKADSIALTAGAQLKGPGTTGQVWLQPNQSTTAVNINSGASGFNLEPAELSTVTSTRLTIGQASGGAVTVGNLTIPGAAGATSGTIDTLELNGTSLTFTGTVDGQAGTAKNLWVNAYGGAVLFQGTVGNGARLGQLYIDPPSSVTAISMVKGTALKIVGTTGAIDFQGGADIAGNVTITGSTGTVNFSTPGLNATGSATISTTGNLTGKYTVTGAFSPTAGSYSYILNSTSYSSGGGGGGGSSGGSGTGTGTGTGTSTSTGGTDTSTGGSGTGTGTDTNTGGIDTGSGGTDTGSGGISGSTSTVTSISDIITGGSTSQVIQQIAALATDTTTLGTTTTVIGGLTATSSDPLPTTTTLATVASPATTTGTGATTATTGTGATTTTGSGGTAKTVPLDDSGVPAYASAASTPTAAVSDVVVEFKTTMATTTAVDAIVTLASRGLPNTNVRAVFDAMTSAEVVSSLNSSGSQLGQRVGSLLQETLAGGNVTYADVKGVLDSYGADGDLSRTYLSLFQRIQKEARADLFAGALEELRQNPEVADLFAESAEAKDAKPAFSNLKMAGMTPEGRARIEGKVKHPSPFVQLRVNGRWEFVDDTGTFRAEVAVQAGRNDIELSVVDEEGDRTVEHMAFDAPSATPAEAVRPREGKRIALLFADHAYRDPNIPPLGTPMADAKLVAKSLRDRMGYETRVVENGTKSEMVDALRNLGHELTEADTAIVYYAGHGFALEETGKGYWLPVDARTDSPAQWISNSDVARLLHRMPAKHVLLVADSCYSGAFTKEQAVADADIERDPNALMQRRSVMAMSSGGDEPVLDGEVNSPFASAFVNQVGKLKSFEPGVGMFKLVHDVVVQKTPQTPHYGAVRFAGYDPGGDYLFNPTGRKTVAGQ